ncbi:hypothetical protein [Pseudonocardia sp.]|uniref:hypothetical protein n=1 Tax=Pseudonocardia sp. TaxID=60912 RepID=UPI0031FCDA5D
MSAPSNAACSGSAASGSATAPTRPPDGAIATEVTADSDPDLPVAVLDEVIYLLAPGSGGPRRADMTPGATGREIRLYLAAVGAVELVGAVLKAGTLRDCGSSGSTENSGAVTEEV